MDFFAVKVDGIDVIQGICKKFSYIEIPAMTSLSSTLTAKKSMKMTFLSYNSRYMYITIFLRRIQRLQIFKIPIDVYRHFKKTGHLFKCFL